MTDDQELQLTDHPPAPWCRPTNVVELREAFARRERGEVCECGDCPEPWDLPACDAKFWVAVFGDDIAWHSSNGVYWCLSSLLTLSFTGWTWDGDGVDGHSRWFRLRRK